MPRPRPRYNKQGWLLCVCVECGARRYVEPHGTTATCASRKCRGRTTEHTPVERA